MHRKRVFRLTKPKNKIFINHLLIILQVNQINLLYLYKKKIK